MPVGYPTNAFFYKGEWYNTDGEGAPVTADVDPLTGEIEISAGGEKINVGPDSMGAGTTTRVGAAEVLTPTGLQAVPPGAVKREAHTFCGTPDLEHIHPDYLVIDSGAVSGRLYFCDSATKRILYSYDGISFTLLHDFSQDDSVEIVRELYLDDGKTAIVVITHATSGQPAGVNVYRSIDAGVTWEVSSNPTAYGVGPSETAWSDGARMIFGEYRVNTPGWFPTIWYSDDGAQTWKTHTITTQNGGHYHWCDAIDGTADKGWFVLFGDGAYAGMVKLQYISGGFVETEIETNQDTHCLSKLESGRWMKTEYSVCAFDPETYSEAIKFQIRRDSSSGKYPYDGLLRGARTVFEYAGVLYAAFTAYAVSAESNGLYASADDGETWACVYRDSGATFAGFRHGWGHGGYIYLQTQLSAGVTLPPTVRIKAMTPNVAKSVRTDHPISNRIATQGLSTFTQTDGTPLPVGTANGGWGDDSAYENPADGAPAVIEVVPGGFDGSGHMLHCRTKAAGVTGKNNIITSPPLSVLCAGKVPVAGDYFVAVVRFRAPECGIYDILLMMRGLSASEQHYQIYKVAGTDWMELRCWGRWPTAPASNHRLWVRCDNPSSDANTNKEFDYYIDGVRLYVSPNPIWVTDNRNGIVNQPPTPDVVRFGASAQDARWSYLVDLTRSAAIEQVDGCLLLVELRGGKRITVSYSAGAYVLSDGVRVAQSSARIRGIADVVRLALVSDGAEVLLMLEDSTGPFSVVGAGVATGVPLSYAIGGDVAAGSYTAGNWSGVGEVRKTLTQSDVQSIWSNF